ncbi:HAMP domain-containing histidine kinase [bacterium]|nr:HAMP domain-containing histidine kinase [bacterium]
MNARRDRRGTLAASRRANALFGACLVLMVAIAAWWVVYFGSSIEERHAGAIERLHHRAQILALQLGNARTAIPPATELAEQGLSMIPTDPAIGGYVLAPDRPAWSVTPMSERVAQIEAKYVRQKIMLIGEGTMLFTMLLVGVAMLHRLVQLERLYRSEMDRFLRMVTHELKTPIAGLSSLLESMALGRVEDDERPRLVQLGLQQVTRLEHLVGNILMTNRVRRGVAEPRTETLDLDAFTREVLDARAFARRFNTIPEILADGAAKVRADRDWLRIILDNLLDNAEKYGEGVPCRIEIGAAGDLARWTIADSGSGIAPAYIERVFDPYFRAPETERRQGTGLGLSISRDLARRMGGDLVAASAGTGQGAQFELTLPREMA